MAVTMTAQPGEGDVANWTDALRQLGLIDASDDPCWTQLEGGVSSELWRVDGSGGSACVKRARPRLAVAAEWLAPVERNASEVAWLELADEIYPGCAPRVLGHLPEQNCFIMEFVDSARAPVWKQELSSGRVDPVFAGRVGDVLGTIHARTANDEKIARRFATDELFAALRIRPYFEATALANPDLASCIDALATRTAATKRALVHGDISPKNVLVASEGPIILDAECAWYGDPAFDVAFCLTHLLLKCRWVPTQKEALIRCFDTFVASHSAHMNWEPAEDFEARVATLLPALLLARVDGKSPVEYLTDEFDRCAVREVARELLVQAPQELASVRDAWRRSVSA